MAVRELSDGSPDGTRLGQNAADLVAFHGATPTDQLAAITVALSTLTIADAVGTTDQSIASVTSTTNAWGFANAQDAIDVLYTIKNLQAIVADIRAGLVEKGLFPS